MLYKIPFYVGNILSCFVPGSARRHKTRAYVNRVLFYLPIRHFICRTFGERVYSIKFVRQVTLGRVVFMVNDKYFVKVFRDVTNKRLRDHEFLVKYLIAEFAKNPKMRNIAIPDVIVAPHAPMYVSPRVAGHHLNTFAPELILKNKDKIQSQAFEIIDALTSIDVNKIPGWGRFAVSMQNHTAEKPCASPRAVLAHFDLNRTNCLFDDDLNIIAVIDWDSLSVANNPDTDKDIFMKYWTPFIEKQRAAVAK